MPQPVFVHAVHYSLAKYFKLYNHRIYVNVECILEALFTVVATAVTLILKTKDEP